MSDWDAVRDERDAERNKQLKRIADALESIEYCFRGRNLGEELKTEDQQFNKESLMWENCFTE